VAALWVDIVSYENFLFLIGSVFVPLFGTFAAAYYVLDRGRPWDVSEHAPPRWWVIGPWLAGFVAYQLVNPGTVGWWQRFWLARAEDLSFTPPTWMSASLAALVVSFGLTLAVGFASRRR
jgi:purine-cytosine permease-like protein